MSNLSPGVMLKLGVTHTTWFTSKLVHEATHMSLAALLVSGLGVTIVVLLLEVDTEFLAPHRVSL